MTFSLRKQFTPLSLEDVRSVLGEAESDSNTSESDSAVDSAQRLFDVGWQEFDAQYVATEVPSYTRPKVHSSRGPRQHTQCPEKRWKGKKKRKGQREKEKAMGFDRLRQEFPGAWFRGGAHRGPSKANGFPWDAGDDRRDERAREEGEHTSDCSSDDEVPVLLLSAKASLVQQKHQVTLLQLYLIDLIDIAL